MTAAASVMALASPAKALKVSVGGESFGITSVTGTFNQLNSQLGAQPWWTGDFSFDSTDSSADKATQFSNAAQSGFTQANSGLGLLFAFDTRKDISFFEFTGTFGSIRFGFENDAVLSRFEGSSGAGLFVADPNLPLQYAVLDAASGDADAIPTPALLPGLLGVAAAAIRKRNGDAAEA